MFENADLCSTLAFGYKALYGLNMPKLRKGFLLTNGSGCYIVDKELKNEIEESLAHGWRIALIRPICVSMAVKLKYLPPETLQKKIYSYSLCIMEKGNGDEDVPEPSELAVPAGEFVH